MNKNFNEDNYIDFSVSTIVVNHFALIVSFVSMVLFFIQADNKELQNGSAFMFWLSLICFIYNLAKIIKHSINRRKPLDIIVTEYQYSNRI